MAETDMTGAYFVVALLSLVVLSLVSLVGLNVVLPWWFRRRRRGGRAVAVKPLAVAALNHSVKQPASSVAVSAHFPASRPEAEAEGRGGSGRGSEDHALVTFTEKALQSRDTENYQRGVIDAYATLLRGGFLDTALAAKQKGKMQQALADTAGNRAPLLPGLSGRAVERLAAALDEVPVVLPADEARATPLAKRTLSPGVSFEREPVP